MAVEKIQINNLPWEAHVRYEEDQRASRELDLPPLHPHIQKVIPDGLTPTSSHLEAIPLLDAKKTSQAVLFSPPKTLCHGNHTFTSPFYEKYEKTKKERLPIEEELPASIGKMLSLLVDEIAFLVKQVESLKTIQKM